MKNNKPSFRQKSDKKSAPKPSRRQDGPVKSTKKPTVRHVSTLRNTAPLKQFTVTEDTELLVFLIDKIAGQGRNSIKSVLARGQVSVDDRVEKLYNYPLKAGQVVAVSKERITAAPQLIGLRIVHEDDDLIVVNKDTGLLSVASEQEGELTAYRQLTAYVRATNPDSRIFVLHRLDRDTSGIMMFAKSEKVQQKMQTAWTDVVKERTYVALVEGFVKKQQGTISSYLKETSTLKMYSSQHAGDGLHAVTHYKVMNANRDYSLLEVNLETGRKNQIRVHMQDLGHPIAGDKKYGAKLKSIGRLGLHARVLAFEHPTTGKIMRFETPIPKQFLSQFKEK
ncbi:MAG: RluA family pseudouridine synthase [Candidatus Pristimantibacillus lignocellulolyticus]|uniref:Pseudouridine synthase n=1 Tax=Candidatus Pristimantibacillus lignocellulolyticus TaxID=2994561 RepID=A0A9J6ZHU8_9BACL|nr:MAG: RluA family pseudouridine synthase [Candidatus Pristimantibacillus lignocellulolyticus]